MVDFRKRRREHDNDHEGDNRHYFQFIHCNYILLMYFLYLILLCIDLIQKITRRGTSKREETSREKRFCSLGKYMFSTAYRMSKVPFCKLYSILKSCLDAISFQRMVTRKIQRIEHISYVQIMVECSD